MFIPRDIIQETVINSVPLNIRQRHVSDGPKTSRILRTASAFISG
jgi:hypothetical protein